jgi:hypothetical protein
MRMRPINIVSDEYSDDCRHWSSQYCINYLPTVAERSGTRTEWMLRQAPGLKPLVHIYRNLGATTEDSGPIRGMRNVEGKLFVVAGNTLFQITNSYVAIPYGTVPGVGRVSMTHNQNGNANELLIVNGSAGYVFNTSTLAFQKVTDDGYPGAFIAWFIDGYLAQVEPQGRYWFHSDLANALSYNTLDVYEAEGQPDRIVTGHTSHREALIFGKETIEPYVNAPEGDGTAPFQRASNTVIECGCAAKFSVESLDNSVFFLDDKRIVRRLDAYTPVRVSTQSIEQALAECTQAQIAAAFSFTWEDRGHKVYYLTVPGKFTFGYDVLTQRWHRRLTKGTERWRLNDLVFWNGMWVGGDYQSGRLYELEWDYSYDGQDAEGSPLELVRKSGSGVLHNNQNALRVHAVELICRVGGEATTPAAFPTQPLSPTITGTAPDGLVAIAYSGYTYTIGGGTGALRVTLRSGALPTGLTISSAGVVSMGEITAIGSFTYTLRVTDENGLYAELTDTIEVASPAFASRGNPTILYTSSPYDWDTSVDPGINATNALIESRNGKVFVFVSGAGSVSNDAGATWTTCTGIPAISPVALVYSDEKYFLVVGSGTNIYVSTDGIAFSPLAYAAGSEITGSAIAVDETIIVARTNSSQSRRSIDGGATWIDCPLVTTTPVGAMAYNPESGVILGAQGGVGSQVRKTTNFGASWTSITNPLGVQMAGAIAYGNDMFMVVGGAGACATSDDDGLTWVPRTNFGNMGPVGQGNELIFDGELFCVCGVINVLTSPDGVVWTPRNAISPAALAVYRSGQ